ncbi:MAG: futalosine hydrolase [Phycisphaerales bacterium]
MTAVLANWQSSKRVLLVVAAPAEWRAVVAGLRAVAPGTPPAPTPAASVAGKWATHPINDRFDCLLCGIGKVNAAAATALALSPHPYAAVLSLGIAGMLRAIEVGEARRADFDALPLTSSLLATSSIYADEGLDSPTGFVSCSDLGFPLGPFEGNAIPAHPALLELLRPLADRLGPIATVSTCSGTDALARQVCARTGALAEAMEGAAIAHICARLNVPFAEIRTISNTTGNRQQQRWDLPGALARLTRLAASL